MYELSEWNGAGGRFEDLRGHDHELCVADLLDLALEGRDAVSGQRSGGLGTSDPSLRLTEAEAIDAGWRFCFSDARVATVSHQALADWLEPPLWQVVRQSWQETDMTQAAVHEYAAVLSDPEALRSCLLQVARLGFARLRGAPAAEGEVARLIAAFGPVRETNYGLFYDVRVKPDPANLADTALALAPHTDNPYRATPPDLQVLHCLTAAGSGGETRLVDGYGAVARLRASDPAAFDLLTRVSVRYFWSDGETRLTAEAPVIALDRDGEFARLRYNPRSLDAILTKHTQTRAAWREAWAVFTALMDNPDLVTEFRLDTGDMVIMDNRRILHGRAGFAADAAVERHLQGAYADSDGLYSTLYRLTADRADRGTRDLAALFASDAMAEAYGEDVSIGNHMLQSAALAVAGRLGEDMVAAALLHDIGWLLGGNHEDTAADRIALLLGPAISEPIRLHVAAKRYLVATQPAYEAGLSDASRYTLGRQGGPMTSAECQAFRSLDWHEEALRLRGVDDSGKLLKLPDSGFAAYAALLRSLAIRHLLNS